MNQMLARQASQVNHHDKNPPLAFPGMRGVVVFRDGIHESVLLIMCRKLRGYVSSQWLEEAIGSSSGTGAPAVDQRQQISDVHDTVAIDIFGA